MQSSESESSDADESTPMTDDEDDDGEEPQHEAPPPLPQELMAEQPPVEGETSRERTEEGCHQ